ncbi:MAG: 2,3-bisphosphoglycerate-independent phosphoglycerate mutase, partial [Candidatus Woesebacteria bacterium GW2011_GWB1_45_5]
MNQDSPKFVLLTVLDGWGIAAPGPGNAISQAETPNINRFMASYPHTQLGASGESVGLPHGEAGNTETGHLNLGAGRIIYQDLQRINMSIADGSFFKNQTLTGAIDHARTKGGNLHYMGLIGAGGVHSNIEHLYALIDMAKRHEFSQVFLHLFTDGRDSPPTAAKTYISQLKGVIEKSGIGKIASIMGRYWAMDRDLRWERTQKAYLALTRGQGSLVKTPEEAIDASYAEGKTDEFIEPALISNDQGTPTALIKENDSVVFFNFRIDRPRQLSRAFVFEDFSRANVPVGFDPYKVKYEKTHLLQTPIQATEPFLRGPRLNNLYFATMTEYEKPIVEAGAIIAFPPEIVKIPLGRVISEAGYRQLRAAESEKERFVTFYFNGQQEAAFEGEERLIIPSPKIPTYDLKPEMSSRELTEAVLARLKAQGHNGVVHFYTPERYAMMFYKDGLPIGFYHDGATCIESQPDESRKVAALPGAKIDICGTKPIEELLRYDLLQMVNLAKLWEAAQLRNAAPRQMEQPLPGGDVDEITTNDIGQKWIDDGRVRGTDVVRRNKRLFCYVKNPFKG